MCKVMIIISVNINNTEAHMFASGLAYISDYFRYGVGGTVFNIIGNFVDTIDFRI